jgi:hypothetical protein
VETVDMENVPDVEISPDERYLLMIFAKVEQPIDLNVLTYDGYTLNEGESLLAVDGADPANTRFYMRMLGKLVPDPNFEQFGRQFRTILVDEIKDGDYHRRWFVRLTDGAVTGVEECSEINTSGFERKLKELDEKYLTPRVLAGLAEGDAYALAQWEKHEAEAQAIRDLLAQARADAAERESTGLQDLGSVN